ncbi:DUF5615 family PIN-like protein [Mycobacterium sp. M1]|uniref:DUF5615 family PIN-like protein n=1 Tax=Mycolicibacter acidiphilus TaxID=2835306 RepID=A0ABS5RG90_9MYCO|nr:DUF5615 family PIN-like protein [Mycolicibacter acidiphilus]MBS9533296.1 DUF5615 family PIN-like protein [Mycolicibacter acidiphilus]
MRLLLDEMYPPALAEGLAAVGVRATTAGHLGLAGRPDTDVFATAVAAGFAILTENVGDFTRIAAEHLIAGGHHTGLLVALSARFSRRPSGIGALVTAVAAVADEQLEDRTVYLNSPTTL